MSWVSSDGSAVKTSENEYKAGLIYEVIERGDFYSCPVHRAFRSTMNIPFRLKVKELESVFLASAEQAGLFNLKGHRSVGGMRASIYNAVPVSWVEELVKFMNDFENEYG